MSAPQREFKECLTPQANIMDATNELLLTSFFLPKDVRLVLEADGWKIPPIQVLSNKEFWEAVPALTDMGAHIEYTPSILLVKNAKQIGVSVRTKRDSVGETCTFIVAKLWQSSEALRNKDF